MQIRIPSQQQSHRCENPHRQEYRCISRCRGIRRCVDDESHSRDCGREGNEGTTHFVSIGEPAEEDDHEEAEDVGRRGEAVGLDLGEAAHL